MADQGTAGPCQQIPELVPRAVVRRRLACSLMWGENRSITGLIMEPRATLQRKWLIPYCPGDIDA